jgi:hypothetical protein
MEEVEGKGGVSLGNGVVLRNSLTQLTHSLNVWKQALRELIVTFHDFE